MLIVKRIGGRCRIAENHYAMCCSVFLNFFVGPCFIQHICCKVRALLQQGVRVGDGHLTHMRAKTLLVWLSYFAAATIWGSTWPAMRICIQGFPLYEAGLFRYLFASCIMCFVILLRRQRIKWPSSRDLTVLFVAGLANGVGLVIVYLALNAISSGLASITEAIQVLILACLSMLKGEEKFSWSIFGGSVIAILGIALIFHDRMGISRDQAWAVSLTVVAAAIFAIQNFAIRHIVGRVDESLAIGTTCLALGLPFLFATWWQGWQQLPQPVPIMPMFMLVYLAVFGSTLVFAAYFYTIKEWGVTKATTIVFLIPVVALLIDVFVERRVTLDVQAYVGIAIVIAGAATSLRRMPQQTMASPQ
jgi:drug/metabolite transporter (DMT)-like permease